MTQDLKHLWQIDPAATFLNHGSFGACPTAILRAQDAWRARMEAQLVQFFARDLEDLLQHAAESFGAFVGADGCDIAWVNNATAGVNTVLRSLCFKDGDELLTIDHTYNACKNALDYVAQQHGATVVVAKIPFPLQDPQQVVDAILAEVTPRTKLAMIDHVTSPTGLVLPMQQIVQLVQDLGVDVLVDGAHAPGMLPLNLNALGAAYYTGNCHKWLCTPKGSAFLHVRRDRQHLIRPLSISHGANSPRSDKSRFQLEFSWSGTDDPSPWLCVPQAIDYIGELLPGGWPQWVAQNRALALYARDVLCDALEVPIPAPDSMIGTLAAVPIPPNLPPFSTRECEFLDPLCAWLWNEHRIEVPVFSWPSPNVRVVRIAAQAYNDRAQYDKLAQVLRDQLTKR